MRPNDAHRKMQSTSRSTVHKNAVFDVGAPIAAIIAIIASLGLVAAAPATADTPEPDLTAAPAPEGRVPGSDEPAPSTATSPAVDIPTIESWTPTSHSITEDGTTTLEVFAQPAFKRDADGWSEIDPTITPGSGEYPFEALGLANPVHFGINADALVTIDTVEGPVVFGLEGATVTAPTLSEGVVTYADVFDGVDLEFRTEGGRIGKHLILADESAPTAFEFTISDTDHSLGDPVEGSHEAWTFTRAVAFGLGIELPAPAAWPQEGSSNGLPGSAHQQVTVTDDGYRIDLSVDELWAESVEYPLVLDPGVEWTDETWVHEDGLSVAFAPAGEADCDGGPCELATSFDGRVSIGPSQYDSLDYLAYVGTDVGVLAGREVSAAVLSGYEYWGVGGFVQPLCSTIDPGDTGADVSAARCAIIDPDAGWTDTGWAGTEWGASTMDVDLTDTVRAAVRGEGPTGTEVGFAVGTEEFGDFGVHAWFDSAGLRLVYTGYPVPRPLTEEQTWGCVCFAGKSSSNQALAADPVNTATGALIEHFSDVTLPGVGQSLNLTRTYNSFDAAAGPFGPGWSHAYGASVASNEAGEVVFSDGSGTRTRFGALLDGGYAPIDPAVSATLTDGPDGGWTIRNLAGDTMTFDSEGRLTEASDDLGEGLTFSYANGQLSEITDELGQTLTFTWDAGTGDAARIVSAATSDGRTVGYGYADTAGAKRLTSVTAVDGTTTTYGYDDTIGGLSSITDPLGNISARNTFDADGRVIAQLDETGAETTFAYDDQAQTTTITDPTGKVRIDVYNGLNLVKQIDGNGNSTQYFYDGDNNAAAVTDADDKHAISIYDDKDRLVSRSAPAPLHHTDTWTYDDDDRVTSHTDPAGQTTTYTYDSAGLMTSIEHPDGGIETFTYTTGDGVAPANLLASATDPLERTTTFEYNSAGDRISTTSPEGRTTTSTYDAAHRLLSTTSATGATTTYTYDDAGRVLTVTDPTGATTTNVYDDGGRLTETTDPLGRPTKFNYDRADRLIRVRDAEKHITRTSYDRAGRVESTTDALGQVTTYAYNDAGHLVSTTDPLGRTTTNTVNALGQVTSVTDPAGAATSYEYDVLGRVVSTTDADGVTTTTTFDERGNVAAVTDGAGGYQQTSYDLMNRPSRVEDSDGVWTEYQYDLAGQLTAEVRPRSDTVYTPGYEFDRTTYAYDDDGLMVSTVNPLGNVPGATPTEHTSTVSYDDDGRPVVTTDPLGRTTTTEYDDAGRPVAVTDPAGDTTTTSYNANGWVTNVRAPGSGVTRYAYDRLGNVRTRIDVLGRHTTYTYDGAGRMLTETDPLGRVTEMTYDAAGNLASIVKPSGTATGEDLTDGTITYTYDDTNRMIATEFSDDTVGFAFEYSAAGRVEVASRVDGASVVAESSYEYDEAGRTVAVTRTGPGASAANYAYTSAGRVSGASWSTGMQVAYWYNPAGQVAEVQPSGTGEVPTVEYGYDAAGRMIEATRDGGGAVSTTVGYDRAGQMSAIEHAAAGSVIEGYDVTRNEVGFPTRIDTSTAAGTDTALFKFDVAGRVVSECYPEAGDTCTGQSPKSRYTYDRVGNRVASEVHTLTGGVKTVTSTDYTYDDADQLITETVNGTVTVANTWSANGVLASSIDGDGTATFDHDLTGELIAATLGDGTDVSYTHDASGNRTSRTVDGQLDVSWMYDEQLTSLPVRVGETDAVGVLTTAWLPDAMSPTGAPLAQVDTGTDIVSWLLTDATQNITTAVGVADATVTGTATLGVFGTDMAPATGVLGADSFAFSGQYLDGVTGLYDMRARDYHAGTGRFTSPDPVSVPVGQAYFASYVYGYNNPLIFTDPTGQWSVEQWEAFFTFDSSTADAAWEGVENLGDWSAGFGDTLTFGGTAQIRELISYETGGGRDDMVDNCSLFYEWGGYGGDLANAGLAVYGFTSGFKSLITRLDDGLAMLNRTAVGSGSTAVQGTAGTIQSFRTGTTAAKTVDGVVNLGKGWRATSFGDEAASFEYHFSKHGATAGVTRQQYADDALGWARNPAGTGKPVQLKDGTDGLRFRSPGGGPGGILDNDGNIITYWYR